MEIEEYNNVNYLIFQNRISLLTSDSLNDFITKDSIIDITGIEFDSIKEVEIFNNDFYIITNDYKLIYVKGDRSFYQVLGNGDVGKIALIKRDNNLFIFGSDTLTYIDIENKNFPGNYQRFNETNINYTIIDNAVYGIRQTLRGFELWKGKITNF
jgi:hypothetical protein